jgi:hypothetical protein
VLLVFPNLLPLQPPSRLVLLVLKLLRMLLIGPSLVLLRMGLLLLQPHQWAPQHQLLTLLLLLRQP